MNISCNKWYCNCKIFGFQSGHKANDARKIAERAVKIAEERVIEKNEISRQNYAEEQKKIMLKETEENDKESTFYNVAMQLAR